MIASNGILPAISGDGRFVADEAEAPDPGGNGGNSEVFLYDAVARTTTIISRVRPALHDLRHGRFARTLPAIG